MATTRVFVDDAVLGRLPTFCAKTGVETVDHLSMTVPVGASEGFGIAWLLVFAGPIGWLGLFIYAMVRRVETLTIKVPYSDAAYAEFFNARRTKRNAGLASNFLFVIALLVATLQTFSARVATAALVVLGLGFLIIYIVETLHARTAAIGVELDGSRRWVTLSRVSDAFAEAVTRSRSVHTIEQT